MKTKMTNLYDEVKTIYNRTKTLEGEAYDKAVDEEIELISKKIEEFAQKGKPSYDHELYGSLRNANEYIRKYYAKQGFNVRVIDCRIFKSIDSDIPIRVIIEWDN